MSQPSPRRRLSWALKAFFSSDRKLCLALVPGLCLWSLLAHQTAPWTGVHMFGWEYGNIAESLVRGEGFSGAMTRGSGPTAWMPPMLAWIYALVFLIAGIRSQPAVALAYLLKASAMALTLWLLLRLLRLHGFVHRRTRLLLIYAGFLWLDRIRVLYEVEDVWLQNLLVALCLSALSEYARTSRWGPFCWISALLAPLTSPVSCAAFGLCLVLLAQRQKAWKGALLTLMLAGAVTLGWTVRNRLVLGQAYPIKSNLWFDFVEANLWSESGVVDDSIFTLYHPVNINQRRDEYLALGERRFLETYQHEAASVSLDDWLHKCQARARNAFWMMRPEINLYLARWMQVPDVFQLHRAGLAGFSLGRPIWLFCDRTDAQIEPLILRVHLRDSDIAIKSRRWARERWLIDHDGWDKKAWGFAHAGLVTLALLLILANPRLRQDSLPSLALLFYLLYLIPYILVSHYERYQVCVTALQILLLALAQIPRPEPLPRFAFTAHDRRGELRSGRIAASDEGQARRKLQALNLDIQRLEKG